MSVELAMQTLINLSVLLLIGISLTIIASKIKISNIFLLILSGIFISYLNSIGYTNIVFSDVLLVSLALITLVMVVLEGSSKFTLKRIEQYSIVSLRLMFVFIFFSLAIISFVSAKLFFGTINFQTTLFSMILAITLTGTDPSSVFKILKTSANRAIQTLQLEAIFNTPFTIILPFIVINILTTANTTISQIILSQVGPLVLRITEGIGMGVLLGYFVAKIFKRFYSKDLSPLLLLTAALIAYISSEAIGGSGVLTVATMGIMLGNMLPTKEEIEYQQFSGLLSNLFIMIVFILVGSLVDLNFSWDFILKVVVLYLTTLVVRLITLAITLSKEKYSMKEKVFMTFMMPKGVAVAVVVLSLAVLNFGAENAMLLSITIQAIVFSMILSLLVATIVAPFSSKLLIDPISQPQNISQFKKLIAKKKKTTSKKKRKNSKK